MMVACGAHEVPVVEVPLPLVVATSQPPPVHEPHRVLFPEDPTLDVIAPSNAVFHQESWFTTTDQHDEHCREWGLLHARRDEVIGVVNTVLAERGIEGRLGTESSPEVVRSPALVVVWYFDFTDGFFGTSGVDKLVVCTEGLATRAAHEEFDARLQRTHLLPDAAELGAPDGSWRRDQVDHRLEVGLRWSNIDEAKVAAALGQRGYVVDPSNPVARIVPGQLLRTELRGTTLWWWGGRR
jgi:hypothetical protein